MVSAPNVCRSYAVLSNRGICRSSNGAAHGFRAAAFPLVFSLVGGD